MSYLIGLCGKCDFFLGFPAPRWVWVDTWLEGQGARSLTVVECGGPEVGKWTEHKRDNGDTFYSIDLSGFRWTVYRPVASWELAQACVEAGVEPQEVFDALDERRFIIWDN